MGFSNNESPVGGTSRPSDVGSLESISWNSVDEAVVFAEAERALGLADETTELSLDRYRLRSRLGQGGFGTVFEAFDPDLERSVAIKLLRRTAEEEAARERRRLLGEARVLAKVEHPNIVTVHDVGIYEVVHRRLRVAESNHHGRGAFIVMELVNGMRLDAWCRSHPDRDRRLEVLIQAGRAVERAHQLGIVHRDFKPSNVLVTRDGRAKVVDFGLAGLGSTTPQSLDDPNAGRGTPAYMSPEQRFGAGGGMLADQYAFCVTAWEVLSGAHPFAGRAGRRDRLAGPWSLGLLEMKDVPRGPMPRRVARVLARGMRARADERYRDMTALLGRLEACRRRPSRRRTLARVTAASGLALVVGFAIAKVRQQQCRREVDARLADLAPATSKMDVRSRELIHQQIDALSSQGRRGCAADGGSRRSGVLACVERQLMPIEGILEAHAIDPEHVRPGPLLAELEPPTSCESVSVAEPRVDEERRRWWSVALARARGRELMGDLGHARDILAVLDPEIPRASPLRSTFDAIYGSVLSRLGEPAAALAHLRSSLGLAERRGTLESVAFASLRLSSALAREGRSDEAISVLSSLEPRLQGPAAARLAAELDFRMAVALTFANERQEARARLHRASEGFAKTYHPEHPAPGFVELLAGAIARREGELDRALDHFERARMLFAHRAGPRSPLIALVADSEARALEEHGRDAEALEAVRRGLDVSIEPSQRMGLQVTRLRLLLRGGNYASVQSEARAARRAIPLTQHKNFSAFEELSLLQGIAASRLGRHEEGLELLRWVHDTSLTVDSPLSPKSLIRRFHYADALARAGRWAQARPLLEAGRELSERALGHDAALTLHFTAMVERRASSGENALQRTSSSK